MNRLRMFAGVPLLGPDFHMPIDRPFTVAQAAAAGLPRKVLAELTRAGLLRRVLQGVYAAAQVPDDLLTRTRALALVVPEGAVVVDWTAVWLHTRMLPFGQHLEVPPVSFFRLAGRGRLRNALCVSGERTLTPDDLDVVGDLVTTTPLRTALDIGRLSRRDDAIGGLDRLLRMGGFSQEELIAGGERFRGQRGVRQLRDLAPIADPRAESGAESVVRLRWLDLATLPSPTPQLPVGGPGGAAYRLDLGVEEIRFAVEYDGEEFHSSTADLEHDRRRRAWIAEHHGWIIEPVRRANVFGSTRDIERILYEGVARARRTIGGGRRSA